MRCRKCHVVGVYHPICEINGKVYGLFGSEYQRLSILLDLILALKSGTIFTWENSEQTELPGRTEINTEGPLKVSVALTTFKII